jgi:uncharacterized protein (DUF302 family)
MQPERVMMNNSSDHGILTLPSPFPVDETMDRVEASARSKGMSIFLRLDQRLEAEKVGLRLRSTQLLLFGNPYAGTALMVASPSVAIDLPLKALAWEDSQGRVWLNYNSPDYLKKRHDLTDELTQRISGIGNLLAEALK